MSRYVLDVNRAPDDVDREVCPDCDRPARTSPRGLCWRLTTENRPVLVRPLTRLEVASRIERIHTPYHAALAQLLEERRQQFGYAVLLDMHSMPSLGRAGHADSGTRRADVVPGDARGASCAPALSRAVAAHFQDAGYRVRPNDPYMGGFVTRHHGRPTHGVHAIQIELNRDLYMDEGALAYDEPRANRLIPHILRLVERVRSLNLRAG